MLESRSALSATGKWQVFMNTSDLSTPEGRDRVNTQYQTPSCALRDMQMWTRSSCWDWSLVPTQESEWALPTFIILKKDGCLRWISDLHQLNHVIKCRQYHLPIISDILRHSGYKIFTKVDISMQYYSFVLEKESQYLWTIIMPFGKYKYAWLLMGLKCSPDISKSIMQRVLSGIDDADIYIDDAVAFSNDWDHPFNFYPISYIAYMRMDLP